MRTKSKILNLALIALFLLSIIPAFAEEVDLTVTVEEPPVSVEVELTVTVIAPPVPPVADAGGPYSCDRYATLLLDGSGSYDPDGDIISYVWDFGDGTTGTGVKPSHTYSSTGTFTVTLTVTDDDEQTDSDSTTVKVSRKPSPEPSPRPNKKPKADAGPNMKISVDSTIHFSGAESYDKDGRIVSYRWDFGDGTTATGVEADHTYTESGHYTVTLVVKDNRGAEDSDKCHVKVWEPKPVKGRFGELVPGKKKGHVVDALEAANTIVTLNTTEPVTVTILKYEENPHPDDPMPANALPIYVDVEVSNSTAVEWPIYVEIHYTDEEAEGLDEHSLGIYYWKDGEWRRCSDTGVDVDRNVVWAYMTALEASGSPILIGEMHAIPTPPLPPYLSDLTINPEELELGGEVTISFLIQNMDSQSLTYYATMQIGELSLLVDADLEPYESKTVTRSITPDKIGVYNVTVIGLTGSFTVNPVPIPLKPAEFIISDLTVSPIEVDEGESFTVTVNVTNIGEEEGTYVTVLKVEGITVETANTTLGGRASTTISFTLTEAVGEYSLEIEGLTASLTVSEKPAEPRNNYLVATIIISAIAIIYMLWKRKDPE